MQKEYTKDIILATKTIKAAGKLEWVKSLVKVEDFSFENDYIQYEHDYQNYDISFQDFEIGDTIESINKIANIYSCCGDILDKDYMRCPTCQEHC